MGRYIEYKGHRIKAAKGLHEKVMKVVLDNCKKNSEILVLGSGSGVLDMRLIEEGFSKITSVDIDREHYKFKSKKVKFLQEDLNESSFAKKIKKKFDLILAVELIEHLYSSRKFLENCEKLLKDKGKVVLSTPNLHFIHSRISYLLFGYPIYYLTVPTKFEHVSPMFHNIFVHLLDITNLKIVKRHSAAHFLNNFTFYTWKSCLHYLLLIVLSVLLFPLMIFNRNLNFGTNAIYVLERK